MRVLGWPVLACLLCAGVASAAPAEPFDERCENDPPRAVIQVTVKAEPPVVSHDRPLAQMDHGEADAALAPEVAYSRAQTTWEGRVGVNGFKRDDGTVCARASMRIDLTLTTTIVIAREVFETPCIKELALAHELEHARISEGNLKAAADQLEQELREAYASRQLRGREADLLQDLNREVDERWKPRLWALVDEGDVRHRALDDRDKQNARSACAGALTRLLARRHDVKR